MRDVSGESRARRYWESNYQRPLVLGQGVEQIFATLRAIRSHGPWVDLGAGPFSVLWALAIEHADSLAAVDIDAEALEIGADNWGGYLDGAFVRSLVARRLVEARDLARVAALPRRYTRGDAMFDQWPFQPAPIITALGLAALIPTDSQLIDWLHAVLSGLTPGGEFVGASWLAVGRDSPLGTLGCDGLASVLQRLGAVVHSCQHVRIQDGGEFESLILWHAALPDQ